MNFVFDKLEELLKIKSPTGHTEEAILFLEGEFEKLNIKTERTNKNALIATIPGKDNTKAVALSGHIDTLGAMVKEIKPNGRLKLSQIGGYSWNTVEGENVSVETLEGKLVRGTIMTTKASTHVHGSETSTIERSSDNMEVRLDEVIFNKEDVEKLGIQVGDFVHLDPRVEITSSGFIKSRHLDDKAGVIAILAAAKELVEKNLTPNFKTYLFFSNYEEVGHGASAKIPEDITEFIAVDMAAPGTGQESSEFHVTICPKDSSGPYDYQLRKKLIGLAKENKIDYKLDIYPFYGSDASAALRAGHDIRAGLIGPGVDASHSFERTHIKAIENTIKLCLAYLTY